MTIPHRLYRLLAAVPCAALLLGAGALAQADTCAAFVRAALAGAFLECASVAPGQLCYGSGALSVEGDVPASAFERPGQRIDAGAAAAFSAAAPDLAGGQWGVALLRTADALPGGAALLVALGGVTLTNDGGSGLPPTAPARVTFAGGANVRARPDENAAVVAQLEAGATLPATGVLADSSWLRLYLPGGAAGWVRADLLRADLAALPVVTPDAAAPSTLAAPYTAFTLEAEARPLPCAAAPDPGVLVQTDRPVTLTVNGAALEVAGTAFVTVQANGELRLGALEGYAAVTAGGSSQGVAAGYQVRVRRDAAADAWGLPRAPELYPYVRARALPLALLPRPVAAPAFNPVGVTTPAAPAVNPLDSVSADSPCTVAAFNDEGRLRAGPGREFPILGGLSAGEAALPDARAAGSDGMLWWRLSDGIWVRSDVVLAGGDCGALPLIDAPGLPTPTPSGEWY